MTDRLKPITKPDDGYEPCYECDGDRYCWSCHGNGVRHNGEQCFECKGSGLCIVCNGAGQLPAGTRAKVRGPQRDGKRIAKTVGCFRDLGYESAPSLADVRGKRQPDHQNQVVTYLRAGKVLVMSPGLVRDTFDKSKVAGSRSMRTDGAYAWPDSLAYYVDRYAVELPADFEKHMAAQQWEPPTDVDIVGLVPE